jgi:FkbM family methyltransferase
MIGFLVVRARYFFTRKLKCEIRTPDGFLIQTPCELISYWSFFVEHECWSSDWDEELQREVQPLILDVGANAGLFTHWIWTKNRKAEFIVFEPLPLMAAKIRAWGAQTGARISLNQVAVSDHCGEAKFYTDADNDTGASLRNDRYRKNEFVVPVLTLDSAVSQRSVFLIKIDVEGCETEVLRGATRTLKNARFLLIEAHTSEALARICNILPASQWVCQRVGSSDYLFRRQA